jgi:ABC-2 type transport system ATP-binding protein
MNGQKDCAIEINGLTKRYGSTVAVDHISFRIPFGVIFAFLGPNGAGKSTTVEMLECLRIPSDGSASVLGLDIRKEEEEIRKRIGVLPQHFNTFPRLTVRENLKYYAALYENSCNIEVLIASADLVDKADTLYENLSGGLKRRVGVAIALVNDPEVIFLDEPTEGLDPKARRGVWEVIKKLRDEGKTVFLTTHYMEEAEALADIVAIILDGKIRAIDTIRNLVQSHHHQTKLVIHGVREDALRVLSSRWSRAALSNGSIIVPLTHRRDASKIIELLDQRQIRFDEIEMRKPSLEDVFLEVTEKTQEETA